MLRLRLPPTRPDLLGQIAGRLALVGGGLLALGLVAVLALVLGQPPVAAPMGPAPQVWLSSLAPDQAPRFAEQDYAVDAVLPMAPRRSLAVAPRPVVQTDSAALEPPIPAPDRVAPPVAARLVEGPPAVSHPVTVGPTVIAGAPPLTPPQRASAPAQMPEAEDTALALSSLRAPTRSPQPRPRPVIAQVEVAAASMPAPEAPATASLAPGGLLASLLPQRRPEAATRLASLDPGLNTPPQAAPALSVPALDAAVASADRCGPALTRAIPRRPSGAGEGSAVIGQLTGLGGDSRDRAITAEVLGGNLPGFLRDLVPVTFSGTAANGQRTRVTICVMPDYLAVGSDRDFVRVPLGLPAAMQIAERFDMVLPTTTMVDAIYAQASVRLSPSPMEPGAQMASTGYFLRHNATVEAQRSRAGGRLGQLVSGHKKDLVLSNRLNANPGRVAIYGWHRAGGAPIQPLSTVHGASYADYSHGIRLVSRRAFVNGREVDLRDLLSDSRLSGLVSAEGTITHRQLLAAAR